MPEITHLMQDRGHGDVGLSRSRGRAHQQVDIAVKGSLVDLALDAVQAPAHKKAYHMRQSGHFGT